MLFTVSPEQLKFFNLQHYLEIEDILSKEEAKALLSAINHVRSKSPGYPEENLFRSTPLIASLAKKKGWGQIAAALLHKKPLRLAYDKFFAAPPDFSYSLDEESCGLLIELNSRKGLFLKNFLAAKELYNSSQSCYLFLVLTAKYLPEQIHPILAK